jgi:spermidine synthase
LHRKLSCVNPTLNLCDSVPLWQNHFFWNTPFLAYGRIIFPEDIMPVESQLWFEEILEMDQGRTFKIKILDLVEKLDSKFQRIEIYDTKPFGRMLVLDGVVMSTEWDEHAYHEMIAHVPMFVHPNPRNVLVIGGGDGGTVREVIKHPEVKNVDVCEIDTDVIRLCKKHMPFLASSFDDKRVNVYTEDGAVFIKDRRNTYDVILVDSSDPIGPAKVLFAEEFFLGLSDALNDDGIAVTQAESFYYHTDIVARLAGYSKKHFKVPAYYYTIVPTYPSGIIGFTFNSKKYHPVDDYNEKRVLSMKANLRYYNSWIHTGSFALPTFIQNRIKY